MCLTHPDILEAERHGSPESNEPLPLYRCQGCGELVTERFECEFPDCQRKFCENCITHNVRGTGWDVCEDCKEEKQTEILEEARDLACARLIKADTYEASRKALHEYVCLKIELNERRNYAIAHKN